MNECGIPDFILPLNSSRTSVRFARPFGAAFFPLRMLIKWNTLPVSIFYKGWNVSETLTIKREGYPTRCEVCHQTDKFNRATGMCRRCSEAFNEPVGMMPWFALSHWNIPETFHEEFLEATNREYVLWVGRPLRRFADKKLEIYGALVFLVPLIFWCFIAGLFPRVFAYFSNWPLLTFLVSTCFFIHLLLNCRRIDQTLYVLTDRRALVLYANQSAPTKYCVVAYSRLRRKTVDKCADVGHLIFAKLDEKTSDSWGEMVLMTPFKNFNSHGFFFIENVSDVERLVYDKVTSQEIEMRVIDEHVRHDVR